MHKGTIQLSLGNHHDGVTLRIKDESSGLQVLEVRLDAAQFTALLGGLSLTNVEATWYSPEKVGWRREVLRDQTVSYVAAFGDERGARARAATEKLEAQLQAEHPGSLVLVSHYDATNHHRCMGREGDVDTYRVSVTLVHPPQGEEQ